MPPVVDYRTKPYHFARVGDSGKYLGRVAYWKLYVLENSIRVVLHSVLSVQIDPAWWTKAADNDIQKNARKARRQYSNKPQHTSPGIHDIYFVYLSDLTKIMRQNSHLLAPVVPDVDKWVVRLEAIRIPRNIVGHMNWLNEHDKKLINSTYFELKALMKRLSRTGITIEIP